MRILIRPRNMTADDGLRSRIDGCLESTLSPIRRYLEGIDVYLTDVNGPRGGRDKHCRVVAHFPAGRPMVVSQTGHDAIAVVVRAAGRLRRSVRAAFKRRRFRGRAVRTRPRPFDRREATGAAH